MAQVGQGTERFISGREFLINNDHVVIIGIVVDSTARDTSNNPTTTLIRSRTMGIITLQGTYAQYDDTAADGTAIARGHLMENLNLLDVTGTAVDKQANMLIHGYCDYSQCLGIDANGKADMVSGQTSCIFYDE